MVNLKMCKNCRERIAEEDLEWEKIYYSGVLDLCPNCKNKLLDTTMSMEDELVLEWISDDINFLEAMIKLKESDPIEYALKMSQFRNQVEQQEVGEKNKNTTKCPKCGSTNIQIVPRKWSLLTGFLTNKTDRVCVNCKHKF